MRHRNQRHRLGVKTPHRLAMLASLGCALIEHGRIKTTLAKAKALRPFIERVITYAKKAQSKESRLEKYNYKQLALAKLRDHEAVEKLFSEWAGEFTDRQGGYTRIYKIGTRRRGDAAEMALIEFVKGSDEGYEKKKPAKKAAKKSAKKSEAAEAKAEADADTSEPPAEEKSAEPDEAEEDKKA